MTPRLRRLAMLAVFVIAPALLPAAGQIATETVLVGVRPGEPRDTVRSTIAAHGGAVRATIDEIDLLIAELRARSSGRAVAAIRALPSVRYAEVDRQAGIAATPNDPLYERQWGLSRVRASGAWDALPGSGRTIVAVLDTGIDYGHPDLAGQISPLGCDLLLSGVCGAGGRGIPAQDYNGHGTHVAGIIGAVTNNREGVASVGASRVTLLPIKISVEAGGRIPGAVAIQAIVFAVNSGAKVINMSFGAGCANDPSPAYRDAIDFAERNEVLLVLSAGNGGGCHQGTYPASDPRVLAVAAVDAQNEMPSFSGRGAWVGVAAPGVEVLSTYRGGGYATLSGTSMAAPHVAGLAALLYQVPGATRQQVKDWISGSCEPQGLDVRCGGVVNAERAVRLALGTPDPAGQPPAVEIPVEPPPATP